MPCARRLGGGAAAARGPRRTARRLAESRLPQRRTVGRAQPRSALARAQRPLGRAHQMVFFPGFTPDTGGLLRGRTWRNTKPASTPRPGARHSDPMLAPGSACFATSRAPCFELVVQPALATAQWLVAAGRSAAAWAHNALPSPRRRARTRERAAARFRRTPVGVRPQPGARGGLPGARPVGRSRILWQLYPQDDGAHHDKLEAFPSWLDAPADWQAWLQAWMASPGSSPRADDRAPGPVAGRRPRRPRPPVDAGRPVDAAAGLRVRPPRYNVRLISRITPPARGTMKLAQKSAPAT